MLDFDQSCARTLNDMAAYIEAQRTTNVSAPLTIQAPEYPEDFAPGTAESRLIPTNLLSLAQEMVKILQKVREQMLATPLFSPGMSRVEFP